MFSSRFHWNLEPNRLTQTLQNRRRANLPVFDLTQSNPTHAGLEYPPEILQAFASPGALVYEPAPAGLRGAREAVAQYHAARQSKLETGRILLTASTSEAYAYLFKLLCNSGDRVLVPRPSYPLFEYLADMESVKVGQYSLSYHGEWGIDFDSLQAEITPETRALILVNPNNPTGSFLKLHELDALTRLAEEREIALISDEVFADYAFAPDPARVATLIGTERCLSFSMSGLSKIAGLPQMKLGWIVVNGPEALRKEAMEKLEWIADTYLSVSAPVQHAAGSLLKAGEFVQRQIQQRTAGNLTVARTVLAGSAANILNVEGGWYITVQVPRTRSEEDWTVGLLESEGVFVQPGYFFDFESEAFLVVSLLTKPEIFAEGMARLKGHVEA